VEGLQRWVLYGTRRLTGLWSIQAKVECIVLRAAWHWGRDSSVVKCRLGEQDRTHFLVRLPSAWGSVEGEFDFPM
jgi:hypothetical protein